MVYSLIASLTSTVSSANTEDCRILGDLVEYLMHTAEDSTQSIAGVQYTLVEGVSE